MTSRRKTARKVAPDAGTDRFERIIASKGDGTERKQAEETRAQLAAIVENSNDAIFNRSLDGTILSWNAGAERMLGYTAAEAIGRPIAFTLPPGRPPNLARNNEKVLSSEVVARESDRLTKDGRVIDVLTSHSPIRDHAGNIIGASIILQDISALKQAERELRHRAALTQLLEALARAVNEAATPEVAMRACIERICEHGRWTLGHVATFVPGRSTGLTEASVWHSLNAGGHYEEFIDYSNRFNYNVPSGRFTGVALREKRPVWIEDLSHAAGSGRNAVAVKHGLRAGLVFPVIASGEVAAFLEFFADEPRPADIAFIEAISTIASQLARVIERTRTAEARAQLAAIVETSDDAIVSYDPDGLVLSWNVAAQKTLGYTAAEIVGCNVSMLAPPERMHESQHSAWLLQHGKPVPSFESERITKDGRLVQVQVSTSAVRDAAGNVVRIAAILRDVTERKRIEERLRKTARARKVMAESNRVMMHADDETRLLQDMCESAVESGGYRMAWVGYAEHDEHKSVRPVAQAGFDDGYLDTARISWGDNERGRGPSGRAIRLGQTYLVRNALTDPNFAPWRDNAIARGFRSHIALPLSNQGVAFGVLSLYTADVDAFDTDEVALLEELAADLAYGIVNLRARIEHARAEATMRQSEERLRTVFEQAAVGMALRDIDPRNPRWLRVNQKLCDILGYTREELLQLTSVDITPAEERDVAIDYNEKLRRGEFTSYSREKRYVRKDGRIIWANITLTPVNEPDGRPTHLISVVQDITERKQAELERAQLAAIVDTANDAIIGRALDGTILTWNAGAEKMLGYTRDEALGCDLILVPPERLHEKARNRTILQQNKPAPAYDTIRVAKDGRRINVSVSGSPIRDEAGNLIGTASIFHDISERKRAEESRARLAAIVENSNDAIFSRLLDGTILSWNAGAERLYGYTAAEAIGHDLKLVPPDQRQEVADIRKQIQQGKSIPNHETVRVAKDGRRIDISHSASPVKDESGNSIGMAVIARDITARLEAERHFRLSAAVFETTQEGIMVTDASNRIILVNPAFTRITGYTRDEVIGNSPGVLSSGMQDEAFYKTMWATINDTGRWQGEIWDRRKNGEIYCEWLSISTVRNAQGEALYHAAIFSDITKQKQTDQSRANLVAIVENSNDAIVSRNLDRTILSWNAAAERLFGYTAAEVIGQNISLIIPPDREEEAARTRAQLAQGRPVVDLETVRRAKDGRLVLVSISQSPIKDERGALMGASLIFRDISERKQAQERIEYLAQYDVLTELPNRRLFNDRLTLAMARDKRRGAMTAVLLLDLDRFKQINETLGYSVGDKVLKAVTARLRERLREVDTLARLSGDEFVVIVESVTEKAQAARVAEKIMEAMVDSFEIESKEIFVTASIGVAISPDDADSVEKLIENAELAMYQAKNEGRNTLQLYAPEQSLRRGGGLSMESKLRRALDRDEFVLNYQPKVDIRSGAISGAEALIRWHNPELGLVSPADFIPLAEETGLIVPIGEWVLHRACTQASAWRSQGYPLEIAVNLSARQFREKNLCDMVAQTLADSGLDAAHLELEITESMIMHHPEQAIATLRELRELGVTLSVDDFGTGYSSLSYLKRFPVHKLKVDQSFVRDLDRNADDAAIVRAVIALARSLELKTVAEGVESEQQLIFLAGLHCDEYQGYYFSKPLPADAFLSLLQSRDPAAPGATGLSQISPEKVSEIATALRSQ